MKCPGGPIRGSEQGIISPLRRVTLPKPRPTIRREGPQNIQLPSKSACMRYVSRYFEESHCIYWLYSSEQFYARLEMSYANANQDIPPCSFSWMCSLYCIFAVGELSDLPTEHMAEQFGGEDYLDMAKALLSDVCDEASLDSLRALILLVSNFVFGLSFLIPQRLMTASGSCFANPWLFEFGLSILWNCCSNSMLTWSTSR